MYNPAIGRWNRVDALAEEYLAWSSYNYVLGNPIIFIDPDGNGVLPGSKKSLMILKTTLTPADAKFVEINEKTGEIDKELINSHQSESGNFNRLVELVNDGTTYELNTLSGLGEYSSISPISGKLRTSTLAESEETINEVIEYAKQTGKTITQEFIDNMSGESGYSGITLLPNNGKGIGFDDRKAPGSTKEGVVQIYILAKHEGVPAEGLAKATAHELFGHAYAFFLSKNGIRKIFPGHDYKSSTQSGVEEDQNKDLVELEKPAVDEASKNVELHKN